MTLTVMAYRHGEAVALECSQCGPVGVATVPAAPPAASDHLRNDHGCTDITTRQE